jgi:hypothetical protein
LKYKTRIWAIMLKNFRAMGGSKDVVTPAAPTTSHPERRPT